MGDSRCPASLGTGRLHLDRDLVPARTPGTLGRLDSSDPSFSACLGDTPGSLGVRDHADPGVSLVPPLIFEYADDYQDFEDRVLAKHLEYATYGRPGHRRKHPRHAALPIPDAVLEVVEDGFKLRKEAAERCRKLLRDARAALQLEKAEFHKKSPTERSQIEHEAKVRGGVVVTKVRRIGITSGYRGFEHDRNLWDQYYRKKYYRVNYAGLLKISGAQGGPHGPKAVEKLVDFISPRKAAPGFSNHSRGIAVDFFTEEGGTRLAAETGKSNKDLKLHNQRWEKSWFYQWLDSHKAEYDVDRIPSEAWHWEFHLPQTAEAP
jgi:hypothetical protein